MCCQVAYDYGHENQLSAEMLIKWELLLMDVVDNGNSQQLLSPNYFSTVSYCKKIEGM